MFAIQNDSLRIEILDPLADSSHLGHRYCWGGYVWQVHDLVSGPIVRGPEWPSNNPNPFNGQGLPESFRHRTIDGKPLTWEGTTGFAIGAGRLVDDPQLGVIVAEPCSWLTKEGENRIQFSTEQSTAGHAYGLERTVVLENRTLKSITELRNQGNRLLSLEWFAHPFFALEKRAVRSEFPEGSALPPNDGFVITGRCLLPKRCFKNLSDGCMTRLILPSGHPLTATLGHPSIESVSFHTDFIPDWCLIWGNSATFSIEPYRRIQLLPGDSLRWSLRYEFGMPAV